MEGWLGRLVTGINKLAWVVIKGVILVRMLRFKFIPRIQ